MGKGALCLTRIFTGKNPIVLFEILCGDRLSCGLFDGVVSF